MTITFSKSDLYIVKYDQRLESLIKRIVSPDLLSCIFDWLKHVELRPINYTEALSFYQQLDRQGQIKTTLIERIHIDWPNGLTMFQASQLDFKYKDYKKYLGAYHLFEIKGDLERLNTVFDIHTVLDKMKEKINIFYNCHIYVESIENEQADRLRISIFQHRNQKELPDKSNTLVIILFRSTPFLISLGKLRSNLQKIIEQALCDALGAQSIENRFVQDRNFDTLANIAKHHNSLGPFKQFRQNQFDSNPLDLRELLTKRPYQEGEEYVKGRERRKRIVPLDRELIQGRYRQTIETFGLDVAQGLQNVEINLDTTMKDILDPTIADVTPDEELKLKMKIKIKGKNVMEGFRHLAFRGIIKTPIEPWMIDMASQGANKVFVTDDGVLKEIPVDDEEEPKEEEEDNDDNHSAITTTTERQEINSNIFI
ncbi:centromere protein Chl4/mis15/CENP-N [Circinella umbellata]|nr:centromere protein Chl4/mis15/CENP-N [Circinella umbellata]